MSSKGGAGDKSEDGLVLLIKGAERQWAFAWVPSPRSMAGIR